MNEVERLKEKVKELEEKLSYLPKVPSQPYEKELAKRIVELEREVRHQKEISSMYKAEADTHATTAVDAFGVVAKLSDTLQYRSARTDEDERHICPLQLSVIERAIALWSNPGDVVFSPFMGIGSEGWKSVEMGRRFLGFELKESYFRIAAANMKAIEETVKRDGPKLGTPEIHVFKGRESYGVKAAPTVAVEAEETEELSQEEI
jgi:DNA modification methylase